LPLILRDSVGNTVEESSSVFSSVFSNPNVLVAVSKSMWAVKLHQQNPPVLNWRCQLMQVDLCNGLKTVVVVVVVLRS